MAWADTLSGGAKPGADGPYLFYNEDGSVRLVSIGQEGNILDTVFVSGLPGDFSVRVVGQGAAVCRPGSEDIVHQSRSPLVPWTGA